MKKQIILEVSLPTLNQILQLPENAEVLNVDYLIEKNVFRFLVQGIGQEVRLGSVISVGSLWVEKKEILIIKYNEN